MRELFFKITLGISSIVVLLISGCSEVFENDISGTCVEAIIPLNEDTLIVNNVHFKWEELDGAKSYRLQLVRPNFAQIESFILDTVITSTEYFYNLSPGNYQWKIRGENSAYFGAYCQTFDLFIDSVSDLSNQTIDLNTPTDGKYSNQDAHTFTWTPHYAADSYEFDLVKSSINGASISHQSGLTNSFAQTNAPLLEDAYFWKVKGVNATSVSMVSNRILYIDKTNPNTPALVSPQNNSTFNDTIIFNWSSGTDPGTINAPVKTILQISTDSLFNGFFHQDSTYNDSLQIQLGTNTEFFWRLYNRDDAGNSSGYSSTRKFTVN